jgi:hypothetical protein
MSCLLKNEPASFHCLLSLTRLSGGGGVGKPSLKRAIGTDSGKPETERAYHGQGEPRLTSWGRPEPVSGAIGWDELW